jgi:hypothetical protein
MFKSTHFAFRMVIFVSVKFREKRFSKVHSKVCFYILNLLFYKYILLVGCVKYIYIINVICEIKIDHP